MSVKDNNISKSANVWLGAETGLLKSVDLQKKVATNHFEQDKYGKNYEVSAMCWNSVKKDMLYTGHRNGMVQCFDMETGNFANSQSIPDFNSTKEKLVSLHCVDNSFLTCTSIGNVKLWCNDTVKNEFPAGDNVTSMVYDATSNQIAAGGKENLLKVWDLESTAQPVFRAKNVPPNWLQHRVPVWVTSIQFIPGGSKVLTTTGTHHVRIYDCKSGQRRPVIEAEYSEYPLTASALLQQNDNQVVVGNTRGEMASFDLRKMKQVLRCFKGFAGSIRDIACHKEQPYIFSCGLDRYLRVHRDDQPKPVNKVYLKSRLNCILVAENNVDTSEGNLAKKRRIEDNDADGEDFWEKMDQISDDNSDSEDSSCDSGTDVNDNSNAKGFAKKKRHKRD